MKKSIRLVLAAFSVLVSSLAGPCAGQAKQEVTKIVGEVTETALRDLMADLTGTQPVQVDGVSYWMTSRATADATAMEKATRYAWEKLAATKKLVPTFEPWKAKDGSTGRNVIAELTGATNPSEIYVVCAHIDAINDSGGLAPGADDDGTGSAAVLLAAKVLSDGRRYDRTIRFALLTGEELAPEGLYGSRAYAAELKGKKANVKGVLNLDMIGWTPSPNPNDPPVVEILTRAATAPGRSEDLKLADAFSAAVDNYVPKTLKPLTSPYGKEDNDSYPFWYENLQAVPPIPAIPSILVIESGRNPNMHSADDVTKTLNFGYYTNVTKAAVASLAELAVVSNPPEPEPVPGESAVRFLPVVLDVAGTSHYTSEADFANRGTSDASVELSYTASSAFGGVGSGSVTIGLPAGRQVVLDDVIAFLRARGLPIPAGNQAGTVRATFSDLSSADAGVAVVRITAPSEKGRAGVAYVAPRLEELPTGRTWLYGLRRNDRDRTNVALSNASPTETITLRLVLTSAAGDGAGFSFPDVRLGPGQYAQLDDVFRGRPFDEGYAFVSVVSGSGPYMAYAVVNDNGTNDGSFVSFEPEAAQAGPRLLPVVVEAGPYASELVLANPSTESRTVELTYVESLTPEKGAGGVALEPIGPGEQKRIPDVFAYLRSHSTGRIGPKGEAGYAGTLTARFLSGGTTVTAGVAGARTSSPARTLAGYYGVSYPGVASTAAATSQAWVFGLRQDALVRANVAVAAPADATGPVTLGLEVYDGETGRRAGVSEDVTLAPGGWKQLENLLPRFGVRQGYVRVVRRSSSGSFVAYGVVNDGPYPDSASGTDDGTYLPFTNR